MRPSAELHRDLDRRLAVGGAQDLLDVVRQADALARRVEVVPDGLEVGDAGPAR